jgi:two-component system alkaline phosphatase synthesis response regulator PhoP
MAGELILVVDDEPGIVQLARLYLERAGYQVESVGDGRAALQAHARLRPALIVLDLMLPELDGLEVCRRLRAEKAPVPILMLTARDEDVDKILGLELGADDYLTKPFNPHELVARIKAIFRRDDWLSSRGDMPKHLGDLTIDPARREVTVLGKPVPLRNREFNLLLALVEHKGLVMSREKLLDLAWGYDYYGETRTVDVHIGHLRKKLAESDICIETVTGIGYKLVA